MENQDRIFSILLYFYVVCFVRYVLINQNHTTVSFRVFENAKIWVSFWKSINRFQFWLKAKKNSFKTETNGVILPKERDQRRKYSTKFEQSREVYIYKIYIYKTVMIHNVWMPLVSLVLTISLFAVGRQRQGNCNINKRAVQSNLKKTKLYFVIKDYFRSESSFCCFSFWKTIPLLSLSAFWKKSIFLSSFIVTFFITLS